MRKLGIVVTAIACLVMASVSFAADAPKAGGMTFGVDGGIAMPMGDFGDAWGMGFQAGAFAEYGVAEQFAVGVSGDFCRTSMKDEAVVDLLGFDPADYDVNVDVTLSIIPVTAYAKWMPPIKDSPIAPYIMAGGGYYVMNGKVSASGLGESASVEVPFDNKMGFFGGAGVDFKATPQIKIGVYGKYHNILTEGSSTALLTAGVSVGFGLAK